MSKGTKHHHHKHPDGGDAPEAPREKLSRSSYEGELSELQVELVHLQQWVVTPGPRSASSSRGATGPARAA